MAKDKRLSMLAWKYGLEDFRPNEERGRSESNLEPLPFLLGAHHSNYTCLARCLRAVLPWLLYHDTTCSTRTFGDRCKRASPKGPPDRLGEVEWVVWQEMRGNGGWVYT